MNGNRTAFFRRSVTIATGITLMALAVVGIWVQRRAAAQLPGVTVPAWWYLVAAFMPTVCLLVGFRFPSGHTIWQRDTVASLLVFLTLVSLTHIPALYAFAGFERAFAKREAAPQRATP